MIPKIIHQIWIGDKTVPSQCLASWQAKHSDNGWSYMLWDNERVAELLPTLRLKHLVDAEYQNKNRLERYNAISDYLRFEILYRYGGVYIDADTYCLKQIPDEFLTPPCFTCYMHEVYRPGRLASGILGAEKELPLIDRVISSLSQHTERVGTGAEFAGPIFFTSMVRPEDNIYVHPSVMFLPYFFGHVEKVDISNSICVHFWGTTDIFRQHQIIPLIKQYSGLDVDTGYGQK